MSFKYILLWFNTFVKILAPSERELYVSKVPKLYFRAPIWRTIKQLTQLKPTRHVTMKELYRKMATTDSNKSDCLNEVSPAQSDSGLFELDAVSEGK